MLRKMIKRDGVTIEDFIPSKLNKWGMWAADKLGDRVDWTGVVLDAVASVQQVDGVAKTRDLQDTLIKQCLARKDYPHNLMAGRLAAAVLHKDLYEGSIPTVKELHEKLLELGLMKKMNYSDEEYKTIETFINHEKDFHLAHFQLEYTAIKYGLKNLKTNESYESTQFVYMRLAMAVAEHETDPMHRLVVVQDVYEELSSNRINPPTPAMNNLGTPDTGLASCCLYKANDNIPSLHAGDTIAYLMTAASAGIGGIISSRSITDPVRHGKILHKGKLPYLKAVAGAVKANTQGSRGGAICQFVPITDPEIESIIMLQNPRTPEDKQNRDVNIAIQGNKFITAKALKKEKIFLFNAFTAPDLYKAFFSKDINDFETLYNKYEQDESFKKTYIDAYKLVALAQTQSIEVGTLYAAFMDEINRHTPHLDTIWSSNLCVAPDTKILTDKGWFRIKDLKDEEVNVWNGEKFTKTTVRQTSELSKLIRVMTDSGYWLDCTPYHKFYIQTEFARSSVIEITADQLKPGMKLIKFDTPVIEGELELNDAYVNGFYTGDGCLTPQGQRIYLYHEKMKLKSLFNNGTNWTDQSADYNRIYTHYKTLKPKFFVPGTEYSIQSRLEWLAGLSDSDGCIYKNIDNQHLVISSVNKLFLERTALMLQTLGIIPKVRLSVNEGEHLLPLNNGTNESGLFNCQNLYRLIINSIDLQKLLELGIVFHRLEVIKYKPNRDARKFIKILDVVDNYRYDATYCFTEEERHMGMFNGILTGQCLEITQPTEGYESAADLYATDDPGYIKVKGIDLHREDNPIELTLNYSEPVSFLDNHQLFRNKPVLRQAGSMYKDGSFCYKDNFFKVTEITEVKKSPEVSLCSLAAIVEPNIHSDEQYEKTAYYALYIIDSCINIASYPLPHIKYTSMMRRNAGVGLSGIAYSLARKGFKYSSQEGRDESHRMAERHSYFLIKAALKLGKERGNAPWMHKTLWPQGWLPIDTYKKSIDNVVTIGLQYDWEPLREEIIANNGIRFSSLVAHMPLESSSKSSGGPNSLYPIRDLALSKTDGISKIDWAATDGDLYGDSYELAWNISEEHLIMQYGIYQKFADQAISADMYKDRRGENLMYSEKRLVTEYALMVKYGMKTRYYQNNLTSQLIEDAGSPECNGGACKM